MRSAALVLRKDLLVLRRAPVLLGTLVAYPLVIALLVGLVAGYASSKPRVALVDEASLPQTVTIAGETFDIDATIARVGQNVKLVRLSRDEAARQLRNGEVVATITVPSDFLSDLRGMLESPRLQVQTSTGTIGSRVQQQIQALVYSLNRQLQQAFIRTNLAYVDALKHGATIKFLGRDIDVLGLDRAAQLLEKLPPGPERDRVLDFVHDARLALAETGSAMRATANPIELQQIREHGRTWALSAQVQAYALAVTIAFLALLLAASALASERDENVIGRLARGLVSFGQLVWAKVALAAVVALGLGAANRARLRHRHPGRRDRGRRALGAAAAALRRPCARRSEPRRARGADRRPRPRGAHGFPRRAAGRFADRLSRPRPEGGRPRCGLGQRGLPVLARGPVLPGGALRLRPVGESGAGGALARRARRGLRAARPRSGA